MAEQIRLEDSFRPSYRPARQAPGADTDMRRMGMLAAGLGGGIALLMGAVTLLRPSHHTIPVVEADSGPVRVKPLDPGGMKVSGADIGLNGGSQGPHLAPAAEQPEISVLKSQLRQMQRDLAKQAAATAQAEKLAQQAAAAPKIAAPAPVEHASATAILPPPVPVGAAAAPAPVVATGTQVQLAAFSDATAAHSAWDALVKQYPGLMRGHTPSISRTDAAGRTMFRLRTGGFTTVADATSFCVRVRARGNTCSIAAF